MQKGPLAGGADPIDLVEGITAHVRRPARPVTADGVAVGLVAEPLQEVEDGALGLQHEGRLTRQEEAFEASIPVWTLGHADDGNVVDAQLGQDLQGRTQLAAAADVATEAASCTHIIPGMQHGPSYRPTRVAAFSAGDKQLP